ncbi:MAG: type II toxin-antitoxin system VapC family toxin [Verrucomicrobia bacterium]|nr:type II toxin-antitoxin system VapC family toxin [Verrucomicrobiota bacterium]MDA1086243.1 type II toxin-antitoxin system VapC family toxin [Verrucomicrobiota bacterium]
MTYWDTSCVLKLYVEESDSARWQDRALEEDSPLLSSALITAELAYALERKEARGEIRPGAARILNARFQRDVARGRLRLIPVGSDVIDESTRIATLCYRAKESVALRTLDGLHLSTAQLLRCGEIASADQRMRAGASLLGIRPL